MVSLLNREFKKAYEYRKTKRREETLAIAKKVKRKRKEKSENISKNISNMKRVLSDYLKKNPRKKVPREFRDLMD